MAMDASRPPPSQLQDDAGNGGRDKGNSSGEDEARAVIFLSGELVNEGVDVADVAGVECGDMHPKVLLARLPEGRVAQKL